jgi:hypothetical protein
MTTSASDPKTRLVSTHFVRSYLGVDGATFARMRKAGSAPPPVPGTRKYDFQAVKRALDQISGIQSTMANDEHELIERAKRWGRSA